MVWSSTNKQAANQAFNASNGDVFRWKHVWPEIAKVFGLEVGEVQQIKLAKMMQDKQPLWQQICHKYGLKQTSLDKLVDFSFADMHFAMNYDYLVDVTKARQLGFDAMNQRTQDMFVRQLRDLQNMKIIPKYQ